MRKYPLKTWAEALKIVQRENFVVLFNKTVARELLGETSKYKWRSPEFLAALMRAKEPQETENCTQEYYWDRLGYRS